MENILKAKKALQRELKRLSFLEKVNDIDRDTPEHYLCEQDYNIIRNQHEIEKIIQLLEKCLLREV